MIGMSRLGLGRYEVGRLTLAEFGLLFESYKQTFNAEKTGLYEQEKKIDSIFDIVGRPK